VDSAATENEIRFSTDFLPLSERLPYFREVLGRSLARLDLIPIEGRPLNWSFHMHVLDGLALLSGKTSGHLARRSRPLLADGDDDLIFATNRTGFSLLSQRGRECRLEPGAAALLSSAETGAQDFPGPASPLNLRIRRRQLAALVGVPEDALIQPIPPGTEALRLLVDYVDVAVRRHQLSSPELRQVFTTHVYDLVALAIGATRDASELARDRGLRAARLNAAQGDIVRRLEEEALTIADVAGRLGVTPRYLQRLFEAEGTTFTEYVMQQRLARAYRMLADPRFLNRTVTAIAFEVGFGNLSYFNRLFRRHYGATPSDVRAVTRAAESAFA
jgi:AraC-like DNA-binding protein